MASALLCVFQGHMRRRLAQALPIGSAQHVWQMHTVLEAHLLATALQCVHLQNTRLFRAQTAQIEYVPRAHMSHIAMEGLP